MTTTFIYCKKYICMCIYIYYILPKIYNRWKYLTSKVFMWVSCDNLCCDSCPSRIIVATTQFYSPHLERWPESRPPLAGWKHTWSRLWNIDNTHCRCNDGSVSILSSYEHSVTYFTRLGAVIMHAVDRFFGYGILWPYSWLLLVCACLRHVSC